MKTLPEKKLLVLIMVVFAMALISGCSHMEKAPKDRPGYLFYHKPLPEAARLLDEARAAGKDKECPAEFNAAKDQVDKAYEIYMACRTQEAIDMANDAINKIKALCPGKPKPKAEPIAPPVSKPEPQAAKTEPAAVKIVLEDVHFDFDKATLTKEAKEILARDIKVLKANPKVKVQIEGHTCAHGKDDYNMALGERRANAVKEYLASAGIAADRMTTISYGESRLAMPETPTPQNKDSKEAKENRRVHFEVIVK